MYNLVSAIFHLDSKVMVPSIDDDDWLAPMVYLSYILLADILPITGQLISFIIILDRRKYYHESLLADQFINITKRQKSLPIKDNKYFSDSNWHESEDDSLITPLVVHNPVASRNSIKFRRDQNSPEFSRSRSYSFT